MYAVAVYCNDLTNKHIVGCMPLHFSEVVCKFLQLSNTTVRCSVTRKRENRGGGYGLEIPVTYTHRGPLRDIKKRC